MKVLASKPSHFDWLIKRTSCAITPGFRAIEAVDAKENIKGMIGFDNWTENAVQVHMAVDTAIAFRTLIVPGFFYIFEQAKKGVMFGVIPSHNTKSIRLGQHFGFRRTHSIKDGWAPGDDLVFLEMRREECRFLKPDRKVA